MPTPSLPPSTRPVVVGLLEERNDGRWYRIASYPSGATARTRKHKIISSAKLPPGTWEFRHGRIPGDPENWGIWARNLDGPLVGQDERET